VQTVTRTPYTLLLMRLLTPCCSITAFDTRTDHPCNLCSEAVRSAEAAHHWRCDRESPHELLACALVLAAAFSKCLLTAPLVRFILGGAGLPCFLALCAVLVTACAPCGACEDDRFL